MGRRRFCRMASSFGCIEYGFSPWRKRLTYLRTCLIAGGSAQAGTFRAYFGKSRVGNPGDCCRRFPPQPWPLVVGILTTEIAPSFLLRQIALPGPGQAG